MARTTCVAGPDAIPAADDVAKAAEFVRRLHLNADRVDAGVVTCDEFSHANAAIWAKVRAAGADVDRRVMAALRADWVAAR